MVLPLHRVDIASFNASDTLRVDYWLELEMPVPWALWTAKASIKLWCVSPHASSEGSGRAEVQ